MEQIYKTHSYIIYYRNLNFHCMPVPHIIRHLKKDAILNPVIQKANPVVEKPSVSLFEHLTRSVLAQQLSTKAAATIYGRFRNHFPGSALYPEQVLNTPVDDLRRLGLSGQKASYVHNISRHFLENDLMNVDWHRLTDDEIIDRLLPIKGVGLWTIQMILIFNLLREDVFPVDDLAIRQRMIAWYRPDGKGPVLRQNLHAIAEKWRPYRSWACRYIWAAADLKS